MPSAITNSVRILNADALASDIVSKPTYVYIARSTPWPDEELPPSIIGSEGEALSISNDLLAVKKVESTNICSVIPRYNWTSGTVYDYYDHRVNVVDGRKSNGQRYKFYIMTDEFNVYKCISNNNATQSTIKPNSQQLTPFQTPDGYIWKYMYTVKAPDVFSFLTPEWMPVYTLTSNDGSAQWNVQQTAIKGGVHEVVVTNQGIGYSALTPPTVVITGNGSGAAATAIVDPVTTRLLRIVISNPGIGYTNATVSLTNPGGGVGAQSVAILSPVKGHGSDSKAELGGYHKMIKVSLIGDESGTFPTTSFRQSGLLHKPLSANLGSVMSVNNINGIEVGQTITGQTSGATGTVVLVEQDYNKVWLGSVVGDYVQNEVFTINTQSKVITSVENDTNLVFTESAGNASDIVNLSGDLLYVSNRTSIQRSADQTEEVRLILTF